MWVPQLANAGRSFVCVGDQSSLERPDCNVEKGTTVFSYTAVWEPGYLDSGVLDSIPLSQPLQWALGHSQAKNSHEQGGQQR